jgi:hypothetical protein
VVLTACGGGSETTEPPPPPPQNVATVGVSPSSATLIVQQTEQLTATARDAQGAALTGRTITWSSSASGVASVSTAGLVTAVAEGSATITATSEGKSGSATITVQDGGIIGPGGGILVAANGAVTIEVPPGAVSSPTALTVDDVASPPPNNRLVPGTAFSLGPDGFTFALAVTLRLRYESAQLPQDARQKWFAVHRWSGSAWVPLGGWTMGHGVAGQTR